MTRVAASKVTLVFLGLWLVFVTSPVAAAQDKKTVFRRVRDFVVSKATGNALAIDDEAGEWMAAYAADTREGGLLILITARDKPEWTRNDFEGEPGEMRSHGGLDVTVLDEKVYGLGDDNHFIEGSGKKGVFLVFRKGVYHVRIFAASRAAQEEAAWNVVTLIPSE